MDKISALKKLKELLDNGIITDDEFQHQKKRILDNTDEVIPFVSTSAKVDKAPLPVRECHHDVATGTMQKEHSVNSELTEEAQAAKRLKNNTTWTWMGIIACGVAIVAGIAYLLTGDIADRVSKYEKSGYAVLNVERTKDMPYAIVMNNKYIYYDSRKQVKIILPVGKPIDVWEINLKSGYGGLKVDTIETTKKLNITSSKDYNAVRISEDAFLLLKMRFSEDPFTTPDMFIGQSYLILSKSDRPFVIKVPPCSTDGQGNLCWKLYGNIVKRHESYFRKSFRREDYDKIVERDYGHYVIPVKLSLISGEISTGDFVEFEQLRKTYSAFEVGTRPHRESIKQTISQIFREELIESFLATACKVTGIYSRENMKISPDDKYTFVIAPNYYSGRENMALLRVNNKTKEKKVIDSASEIEYQNSRIRLKKYDTFLIFFDSPKDVYYDYNGKQL